MMGAMPHYRFSLHTKGDRTEDHGAMTLANDGGALSFGKGVIQDLMRRDTMRYTGWILDITECERAVASIPLELAVRQHRKK
jgi:hypothetical protein